MTETLLQHAAEAVLPTAAPVAPATPPAAPVSPAAAAVWRLRLLGGFALEADAQQVDRLRSRAATALLARLALAPGRDHARETLVDLLWPDAPPDAGRARLRQTLALLRAVLEPPGGAPVLLADRRALRLVPGAVWCDGVAFEQAVRNGDSAAAQALYRGELLPGFYDEWLLDERGRLDAMAQALRTRLGPATAAAAAPAFMPVARSVSVPLSMPLFMSDSMPVVSTPVASAAPALARLPSYLTRLVGHVPRAARLRALVAEHRLVTVLGAGGSGKTRLAVDCAQQFAAAAPAGGARFERIFFVPLVACHSDTQLLDAVKQALRLGAAGNASIQVLGALDGQPTLLLLDNCEQLDAPAGAHIAWLAERLPLVHFLVTSRRPLGLSGEQEFVLAPLPLPGTDEGLDDVARNPAVALFVDRARAHRPDFHVNAAQRAGLVALVRWLGGLPLAIELAASRARTLNPAQMLALLLAARSDAGSPAAALAWLSRRSTAAGHDARHASMLAVIEWSWKLLTAPQQQLLAALCQLPAGGSLEAAAALTATTALTTLGAPSGTGAPAALPETHALLDELVAQSVLQTHTGQDGQLRYAAAEPVREYAASATSPAQALAQRRQHLAWLLRWAQALPATPPLASVREELPNVQAALQAALNGDDHNAADDANDAVRLVLLLQSSWGEMAIPDSLIDTLAQLLQKPGLDASMAGGGHAMAAWSCYESGRREDALRHVDAALANEVPDGAVRAMVYSRTAMLRWWIQRDAPAARALLALGLPLARQLGRSNSEAAMLSLQAQLAAQADGDLPRAAELRREVMALWQRSGNQHLVNAGRYNLAAHSMRSRQHALALPEFEALAHEARAAQDWDMLAGALDAAGTCLLALQRWPEAEASLRESLRVAWSTVQMQAVAFALWNIAPVLARQRQGRLAAQTMGFAEGFWRQHFGECDASDERDLRRVRRFTRGLLGAAEAQAEWQMGAQRSLAQAVRAVLDSAPGG